MNSPWTTRLDRRRIAEIARVACDQGALADHPLVMVHDLSLMDAKMGALREAFDPEALHAIAVKANPVVGILRRLVEAGAGLECASIEEVAIAMRSGCPPARIVFDSPAKTRAELGHALRLGITINADGFEELARIAAILDAATFETVSRVGIRVNPMVGAGRIAATSVGDSVSKFGVPLQSHQDEILAAFERWPWLTGLHAHVGSQGCDVTLLYAAARRVQALIEAVEARCHGRLRDVDLGGGLPTRYRDEDDAPDIEFYARGLADICPWIAGGHPRLITEFGRALHANCGVALSRVEYVKHHGPRPLVVLHAGADLLLRPVYNPQDWAHEFVALDADGAPKSGASSPVDLAGPLCFGGDFIGRARSLPALEEGDIVAIRDVGAYTLSMWSRHCSRSQPPVYGWTSREAPLTLLRAGETPEGVALDWDEPRRG